MTSALAVLHASNPARELHACLGIDVQAPSGTPGRKGLRVDVGPFDAVSLSRELVVDALGRLMPLLVGLRQLVPVDEELTAAVVVLGPEPSDSGSGEL